MGEPKRSSTTSRFGVSRRESHDASDFYARFAAPELSDETRVAEPSSHCIDEVFIGDARDMSWVDTASVALVVTSPPYFAGKEYEEHLGRDGVPATYIEYLKMLEQVFDECVRTLEPGGRLAVNVANLGRKPYRSLSSDVIAILQDKLRLLLRGEIIWQKARATSGSCAWGSFQRPANPVLRDLTERVIIASKGRFDRALSARQRVKSALPSTATLSSDEYMASTTDLWEIPPESATRVGHPAPFPVGLPRRLIDLYTYQDDLVLDPFMGSGTTAIAALRTKRHFVGYDTEAGYVLRARSRIAEERKRLAELGGEDPEEFRFARPAIPEPADPNENSQARAVREGRAARHVAHAILIDCEFTDIQPNVKLPGGVEVNFRAYDQGGRPWLFDVSGAFTSDRPGLKRTDTLWKALGKAAVIHEIDPSARLVLLTTDAPAKGGAGFKALDVMSGPGKAITRVVQMLSEEDVRALRNFGRHGIKED